jgi:UDP-glucose 6-dehydrogenase
VRIAIIGSSYVGLVSGACFADFGHIVTRVDMDASKIAALQAGRMPIYEPGLANLLETNFREERLTFSTDLRAYDPQAMEQAKQVLTDVNVWQNASLRLRRLCTRDRDRVGCVSGPRPRPHQ